MDRRLLRPQATEDKVSIPHQRQTNADHCTRHGGEIVAELVIPGVSRFIPTWEEACAEIPAYADLRRLIESRAFDVLVYYDRSRLARKASLGMTIEALCERAGIALYETTNPPAQISAGYQYERQLTAAIGAVGAQYEVQRLIERGRIGKANRARRGEFVGKPNWAYYYRYNERGERRIEVDPDAARAVLFLFDLYLEGNGTMAVANILNEYGYRSPTGKPWQKTTVRAILRSAAAYAGYAEFNKSSRSGQPLVRGKASWQPIIPEEWMQRVETEMRQRAANRHLPDTPYRFSSLCYCAQCGRTMVYQRSRNYLDRHYTYLVCNGHAPRPTVREDAICARVESAIRAVMDGAVPELPTKDAAAELQSGIAECDKRLASLQDSFALADNAYIRGLMDDGRYERQVATLRTQVRTLEQDRARLVDALNAELQRGPRRRRLIDVKEMALDMVYLDDQKAANVWLRQHFRVWCNQRTVAWVELL